MNFLYIFKDMKFLGITGLVALCVSCGVDWDSLSTPQSVTIEVEPGVHIPVGRDIFNLNEYTASSPSAMMESNFGAGKIKDLISSAAMPADKARIAISTYDDPAYPTTRTYLLRFPIVDMPLDFTEYAARFNDLSMGDLNADVSGIIALKERLGISYTAAFAEYTRINGPVGGNVDVDIRDAVKTNTSITYTRLGVRIKGDWVTGAASGGFLQVSVDDGTTNVNGFDLPATSGVYDPSSGYTYYTTTGMGGTWNTTTASGNKLSVSVSMTEFPERLVSGGRLSIQPEFVADWTSMSVTLGNQLSDTLEFDFTSLRTALPNMEFDDVKGYVYVAMPGGATPTVTLRHETTNFLSGAAIPADAPMIVDGGNYTGSLSPSSYPAFDLTATVNDALSSAQTLNYSVNGSTYTFTPDQKSGSVRAVLVLKLPLVMRLSGDTLASNNNAVYTDETGRTVDTNDYIRFSFTGFDPNMLGDKDLLGRSSADAKVYDFLELHGLRLILSDTVNTVVNGAYLAVKSRSDAAAGSLISLSQPPYTDISISLAVDYPFAPVFDIVFKKEPSAPYARISVGKGNVFNFGIQLEAKAKIDHTINF